MAARKRNRQSVVCVFCKKRKVKCDKGEPCSTCIKYGNDDCTYDTIGINDDLKRDRDQEMARNEIRLLENKIRKLRNQLEEDSESGSPNGHGPVVDKSYPFYELIGNNPIAAHDDKLNFLAQNVPPTTQNSPSLRKSHSPFHWVTLMKNDTILGGILEYVIQITAIQRDGKNVSNGNLKTVESEFEKKLETVDGSVDIKLFKDNNWQNSFATVSQSSDSSQATEVIPSQDINGNVNLIGRDIPSFRMSGTDNDANGVVLGYNKSKNDNIYVKALAEKIRISLPPKEIIWRLLKVFFEEFYFLFPLFDELDFYQNLVRIIGIVSYKYEPVREIIIEKRVDFAYLGCLLLMLRMTYFLLSNKARLNPRDKKTSLKDPATKMLLGRPISIQFYDFARQCLGMFDILSTSSLPVFQFALFLRLYNMYAPEEGDGDRENEVGIFNNILLNMAVSLGLNREPDNISGLVTSPQVRHLHRKLWWSVYSINIYQSFISGNRVGIRSSDFDTKPLYFEPGFANTNYTEMEKTYCEVASLKSVFFTSVLELTDLVASVRGDVDMRLVSKSLEFMETSILKGYGRILEIMKEPHSFQSDMEKLTRVKMHLLTSTTSINLLYSFYVYYEKKNNLKLRDYYVKKLIVLIGLDLVPLCYELVHNTSNFFTTIPVITLVPDLLEAIHKVILVFIGLFIRCRIDIMIHNRNDDHDEKVADDAEYIEHFTLLNKTTQLICIVIKELIETLVDFSPSYFYAWKLTKSVKAFYEVSSNRIIYDCPHLRAISVLNFSNSNMKELFGILTQTSKNIDKVKAEVQRKAEEDTPNSITESKIVETPSFTEGSHVTPGTPFNWNLDVPNTDVPIDAAGVDKIWTDVMASKVETDGYQNIANYANAGFDNSAPLLDFEAIPVLEGRGMDEVLKSFLEKG